MGERVLHRIIPILREHMERDSAATRQGVCSGLKEVRAKGGGLRHGAREGEQAPEQACRVRFQERALQREGVGFCCHAGTSSVVL
jgi:hypothetical protein